MRPRAWWLCSLLVLSGLGLAACGDGPGGPDAGPATCAAYCATIGTHCAGNLTQYTSTDQCLAICAAFPPGAVGASSGNSLECRAHHASLAQSGPATHCVHAGPSGGGACGSTCEGLCTLVIHACTGDNLAYASLDECMTACAAFDDSEPYDVSDVGGNTLACRLYHAAVATADPVTHCPHTRPVSSTCF
jgi:hypothetical protein